jgi:hypothetical protein
VRLAGIKPELKAGLVTAAFEHHAEQLGSGFAVLSPRMASCPVHRLTRAFGSPTLSGRLWARSGLHHSVERFLVPMSTKARGIWPSVWIWPRKLDVLR